MTEKVKERRPALAAFLSLVMPGLGQVYNGQLRRALVLYAIAVLGFIINISPLIHSYEPFLFFGVALIIGLAVKIFAVIDAFIGARRIGTLELRWYNRWYVYLLIVVVAGMLGVAYPWESYSIPSGAMKPTLLVGDYLRANTFAFESRNPERGDVIIFKLPSDNETDYIKRLIGLPGDRIRMIGGRLHINGEPVPREKIGQATDRDAYGARTFDVYRETLPNGRQHLIWEASDNDHLDNTNEYRVPEGHFFFMGDNRDNSRDSRVLYDVGYVPLENLVSRAEFLFFSHNGWAKWWQVWRWPLAIRFERIGKEIN